MRRGAGEAERYGITASAADITPGELKDMLSFPPEWGPTEWGERGKARHQPRLAPACTPSHTEHRARPHALCCAAPRRAAGPIPFLPDNDILVRRMENQWGPLEKYGGIRCGAVRYAVVAVVLGAGRAGPACASPADSHLCAPTSRHSPHRPAPYRSSPPDPAPLPPPHTHAASTPAAAAWWAACRPATSGLACSRCWAWRATRCACCLSATSRRTRSTAPSTSGCSVTTAPTPWCTSACMAQVGAGGWVCLGGGGGRVGGVRWVGGEGGGSEGCGGSGASACVCADGGRERGCHNRTAPQLAFECCLAPLLLVQSSGCRAPPWATPASRGRTSCWATCPTSTSTPATTPPSPS